MLAAQSRTVPAGSAGVSPASWHYGRRGRRRSQRFRTLTQVLAGIAAAALCLLVATEVWAFDDAIAPAEPVPLAWQEAIETLRLRLAPDPEQVYLTLDLGAGELVLRRTQQVIRRMRASVGKGSVLRLSNGEVIRFDTPAGAFTIRARVANPVWSKPDWAFIEEKRRVPPPGDPSRLDRSIMGKYALNFGHTYFIHGTNTPGTLGRPASHGCVRLGAADIKALYNWPNIVGTRLYVFGKPRATTVFQSIPASPSAAVSTAMRSQLLPYERVHALLRGHQAAAVRSAPYLIVDSSSGFWTLRVERAILATGELRGLEPCRESPCAAYEVGWIDGLELGASPWAGAPSADGDFLRLRLLDEPKPAKRKGTKRAAASPIPAAIISQPGSGPRVRLEDLALWRRVLEIGSSVFVY